MQNVAVPEMASANQSKKWGEPVKPKQALVADSGRAVLTQDARLEPQCSYLNLDRSCTKNMVNNGAWMEIRLRCGVVWRTCDNMSLLVIELKKVPYSHYRNVSRFV